MRRSAGFLRHAPLHSVSHTPIPCFAQALATASTSSGSLEAVRKFGGSVIIWNGGDMFPGMVGGDHQNRIDGTVPL